MNLQHNNKLRLSLHVPYVDKRLRQTSQVCGTQRHRAHCDFGRNCSGCETLPTQWLNHVKQIQPFWFAVCNFWPCLTLEDHATQSDRSALLVLLLSPVAISGISVLSRTSVLPWRCVAMVTCCLGARRRPGGWCAGCRSVCGRRSSRTLCRRTSSCRARPCSADCPS